MKHVTRGPRFLLISRSRGRIFKTHLRLFFLFFYPGRKVESGCGSNWFGKSVGFGKRCVFLRHPAPKNPLSKNHLAKGSNEHEGWQTILLYLYEKKDCIVDWVIGGGWLPPQIKASGVFGLQTFAAFNPLAQTICLLFSAGFFLSKKRCIADISFEKGCFFRVTCNHSHDGFPWDFVG